MTPDREAALRDLLTAIDDVLDTTAPTASGDDDMYLAALAERRNIVRLACKALTDGPLDNTAIQAWAWFLRGQVRPVTYQTAAPPWDAAWDAAADAAWAGAEDAAEDAP